MLVILFDYVIGENEIDLMVDKVMVYGEFGNFKKLNKDDVLSIYKVFL